MPFISLVESITYIQCRIYTYLGISKIDLILVTAIIYIYVVEECTPVSHNHIPYGNLENTCTITLCVLVSVLHIYILSLKSCNSYLYTVKVVVLLYSH